MQGDNFILDIYYYLRVKVLYNVVISPLIFGELKTHFFGSPYVYIYIKTIKYIPYQASKFSHLTHRYINTYNPALK